MAGRRGKGSGSIFRRGRTFYLQVPATDGRPRTTKSLGTQNRAEAERIAKEIMAVSTISSDEARVNAHKAFMESMSANPTLEDGFRIYQESPRNVGQSASARDDDAGVWLVFTRWLLGQSIEGRRTNCAAAHPGVRRLGDVTETIAREFLTSYKASPQTKNKYIRVLKRVWEFNKTMENPWECFRKFRADHHRRRYLTHGEVERVIASVDGEMKTLFIIGAYTGQRMSDCARMRWEYVSDDFRTLTFTPHKTKDSSGVTVSIPIHRRFAERLSSLAAKKTGFVLEEISKWPPWRLSDAVQAAFASVGLSESVLCEGYRNRTPTVGFHCLRSTFITNMADAGAEFFQVQAIVGHMSSELTQIYYRQNSERVRKFIDAL